MFSKIKMSPATELNIIAMHKALRQKDNRQGVDQIGQRLV